MLDGRAAEGRSFGVPGFLFSVGLARVPREQAQHDPRANAAGRMPGDTRCLSGDAQHAGGAIREEEVMWCWHQSGCEKFDQVPLIGPQGRNISAEDAW